MTELALSRRRLLQIGALAPLAGCSFSNDVGPRKFTLHPLPAAQADTPSWSLGIDSPRALKGLDSERIAYRAGAHEIQYYANANWIDLAPEMVQMVLVRSFQNRTKLDVVPHAFGAQSPDFLLSSVLQDFQADGGHGAQVTLVASLSPTSRRRIVRTRAFEATAPSADERIESVAAAFDQALGKVASDLIAWTLATAEEEK